ncbi:MAG: hypothetical protein OSJ83_00480 [Clostridia bacterium]|nr:hypothetical protein [Clostridia bacterium]
MPSLLSTDILEVFGLDWVSMLVYLGNFVLLIAVLIFVLYKPVKKMMREKRKNLDDIYAENEKLKAEGEELRVQYDKMVEDMKLENTRAAAKLAEVAQERADAILEEARKQAEVIVAAAKKESLTQQEQLKTEYRDSVNKLALQIAQKLLEREISQKDNSQLIEQVLSDWESD